MRRISRRFWSTAALALLACGVFAGTAQGVSFGTAETFIPPGNHQPIALANGDFNGDGFQDLLETDAIYVAVTPLFGAGNGFFSVGGPTSTTSVSPSVAVADLNGDGNLDAVASNQGASGGGGNRTATALIGDGTGAFTATNFSVPNGLAASNQTPFTVVTGDFNADGIADLVFSNGGPSDSVGNVTVMLGTGTGTTFNQSQLIDTSATSTPRAIGVGDVNGDGKPDLVVATQGDDLVRVLLGQGDGTFANASGSPFTLAGSPPHLGPRDIVLGDWNKDGKLDFATANNGGPNGEGASIRSASVEVGDGTGGFTSSTAPITLTNFPTDVTTADYDGDGNPDLAFSQGNVPGSPDGGVDVLLGDGSGGFGSPQHQTGPQCRSIGLTTADVNNDGKPDIPATALGCSEIQDFVNTTNPFPPPSAGSVLIDQLRLEGPNGAGDQYVTLYNPSSSSAVNVGGWTLAATPLAGLPNARSVTIPYSTVIPPMGYLNVTGPWGASDGYSLNGYGPSTVQLPYGDGGGLAIPQATGGVKLVSPFGTSVDAAGFDGAPSGYFEGTAIPQPPAFSGDQVAWMRKISAGVPVDTGDNASDFLQVDAGSGAGNPSFGSPILGAPAPASLQSPTQHNDILQSSLLDPGVSATAEPNTILDGGAVIFNRTLTNCSGQTPVGVCANATPGSARTVTRLRFRVAALTTRGSPPLPPPPGHDQAILVGTDSPGETDVPVSGGGTVDVPGMDLDVPPSATDLGGVGSSWTATANLPPGGLLAGDSVNVEFRFLVEQTGTYSFAYQAEDDLVAGPDVAPPPPAQPPAPPIEAAPVAAAPVSPVTTGSITPTDATATVPAAGGPAATPAIAGITAPAKTKKKKARCVAKRVTKKPSAKKHAVKKAAAKKRCSTKKRPKSKKTRRKHR